MARQEAAVVGTEAPVLVVDPDARQRSLVSGLLDRAGYRSEAVATGEQALEAARRRRPQLVVLEVRLRDISGYEVCRALREVFGDELGIVFVSGDPTHPGDRVAGLLIGADDYLAKPLAGDELLARVRALARRALEAPALRNGLTEPELEVLHLLADGNDQQAIAKRLVITPKTVAKHIGHILTKLPARSRAEAVAIADRRGPAVRRRLGLAESSRRGVGSFEVGRDQVQDEEARRQAPRAVHEARARDPRSQRVRAAATPTATPRSCSRSRRRARRPGSVAWTFEKRGEIVVDPARQGEDDLLVAIDAGAEDVALAGDRWEIVTRPDDLPAVSAALEAAGVQLRSVELVQRPTTRTPIDHERAGALIRLLDALEEHADVQAVHANLKVDAEVLERVAAA